MNEEITDFFLLHYLSTIDGLFPLFVFSRYMINIEQDNPLAVQAVSDDGPLALSVMETLRYCDEDGCHAMTVAVDAVATASADDAAAAAVSVSFTRNSLIKKDGSPPAALNVAATATEFVAQATDSGKCLMYEYHS